MHHDKDRIKSRASGGGSDQAADNQNLDKLVRGQEKHATMALLQNPDGDDAGNWEHFLTNSTTYRSARSRARPHRLLFPSWGSGIYQPTKSLSSCTDHCILTCGLPCLIMTRDPLMNINRFVPAVKDTTYYHLQVRGSDTARPLVLYFHT